MRFVLPLSREMRFQGETPTSRLLGWVMPWLKGRRPDWILRLGLFLYDHMGGRKDLPPTRSVPLSTDPAGVVLKSEFRRAFEYSDVWVQDSRLVVLNARDAQSKGAQIMVSTQVLSARRVEELWEIVTTQGTYRARALINAAGPWVEQVLGQTGVNAAAKVRLVRGSHIIVPRIAEHDRCYFLQGSDGRIVFAIPYEQDFTLIGTTDMDHPGPDIPPELTEAERDYLLDFINRYLAQPLGPADVVHSYSGVRPLYDDGANAAQAATRDYVLALNADGAPVLSVFGGKITTYRKLAEHALEKLAPFFPGLAGPWTATAALPGGDFPVSEVPVRTAALLADYPFLSMQDAQRLFRAYGTDAWRLLGSAQTRDDLGRDFGAGLSEAELRWLITHEFARTAEDVLWRRTKLGLVMTPGQAENVARFLSETLAPA
jgi:glycerol-3-phosphate dehydrogenase